MDSSRLRADMVSRATDNPDTVNSLRADTVSRKADTISTDSSQPRVDMVSRKADTANPKAGMVSSRFKIVTDSRRADTLSPKPGTVSSPLKADLVSSRDTVKLQAAEFQPIASELLRLDTVSPSKPGTDSRRADTVNPSKQGTDSNLLRVDTDSSRKADTVSPSKMDMDSLKADTVNPSKPGTDSSPLKADTVSSQLKIPTVSNRPVRLSLFNLKLQYSKLRHSHKLRRSPRVRQRRLLQ